MRFSLLRDSSAVRCDSRRARLPWSRPRYRTGAAKPDARGCDIPRFALLAVKPVGSPPIHANIGAFAGIYGL